MAKISVGEQSLDLESVRKGEETTFDVLVRYVAADGGHRTATIEFDVERRGEVTVDFVEERLQQWFDSQDDADSVSGFRVREVDSIKRGSAVGTDVSPPTEAPSDSSGNGLPYSEGDKVVYYVGGPDSKVYGHTTEAIVEQAPPIVRQNKPNVHDELEVRTGTQTTRIPIEWVVGLASEVELEIDRPKPDLK